jgi:hypothetical protein
VYDGCVWEVSGPRLVLLSSSFRDGLGGVKNCWNRLSSDFGFRNKFIVVLLRGLPVDNNAFSKTCVFESLNGFTDDGGYENRNAYVLIITKSKAMQSLCWLF